MISLIDFILNLVALVLWLNWLSVRFDPLVKTSAASLVGTLRKADRSNPNRWIYLASFGGDSTAGDAGVVARRQRAADR